MVSTQHCVRQSSSIDAFWKLCHRVCLYDLSTRFFSGDKGNFWFDGKKWNWGEKSRQTAENKLTFDFISGKIDIEGETKTRQNAENKQTFGIFLIHFPNLCWKIFFNVEMWILHPLYILSTSICRYLNKDRVLPVTHPFTNDNINKSITDHSFFNGCIDGFDDGIKSTFGKGS